MPTYLGDKYIGRKVKITVYNLVKSAELLI